MVDIFIQPMQILSSCGNIREGMQVNTGTMIGENGVTVVVQLQPHSTLRFTSCDWNVGGCSSYYAYEKVLLIQDNILVFHSS